MALLGTPASEQPQSSPETVDVEASLAEIQRLALEGVGCMTCEDSGFVRAGVRKVSNLADGHFEARTVPCPACRPVPVAIGLPERVDGKTFDDFNLALNPGMRPALVQVSNVAMGHAWCALLMGAPGLGKTLLAAGALAASTHSKPGFFWEWGALLRNIRQLAFGDNGPHLPEEDVLKPWQETPGLLVLDDVGAEKMTEWAAQTLYAILNARYQSRLPTIVTTNNPDAIDERIVSRLYEGAIACRGRDVRRQM